MSRSSITVLSPRPVTVATCLWISVGITSLAGAQSSQPHFNHPRIGTDDDALIETGYSWPGNEAGPADVGPIDGEPADIAPPIDLGIRPHGENRPWMQRRTFRGTWVPGGGDDYGTAQFDVSATVMAPSPWIGSMLTVTPSFGFTALNGPDVLDAPSDLYSLSLTAGVAGRASETVAYMVGISPGLRTDFENTGSDAFRMTGFASGTWQYAPEWQLQFGVAYLNREDLPVLPIAGLVWTPNDDTRVDIGAPRPRVARRIVRGIDEKCVGSAEDVWVYLAGEVGGGTWAVQRASGEDDLLTLRDFRLVVGLEGKPTAGAGGRPGSGKVWSVESGYVFGRKMEYDSGPELDASDTLMLRAGFSY